MSSFYKSEVPPWYASLRGVVGIGDAKVCVFFVFTNELFEKSYFLLRGKLKKLLMLYKVCMRDFENMDSTIAERLSAEGLLIKEDGYYRLSDDYKSSFSEKLKGFNLKHLQMVAECFKSNTFISRSTLSDALGEELSDRQIRFLITKMEKAGFIERKGGGKYVQYSQTADFPKFN